MDNLENILKSLLPLIIIIVVSWLFSSLGSRLKKQGGTGQDEDRPAEKIFDFLTQTKEEAVQPENDTTEGRPADAVRPIAKSWPGYPAGGPQVTPKPIKPKWWGA